MATRRRQRNKKRTVTRAAPRRTPRKAASPRKRAKPRASAMAVVEVPHLSDAAMANAAIAPEKGQEVVVETPRIHEEHIDALPATAASYGALVLTVRVRDWFSAVPDADASLMVGDRVAGRQKTDLHGEAQFGDLAPGEYRLEVAYRGDTKRVVNLAKNRTVTVRFW